MSVYETHSPAETIELGRRLGKTLQPGSVVAYRGGLGMGKTCMTRGIALALGLGDVVMSPTFALVNEHRGQNITLCHFDMYRVNGYDDLYSTGFYDYLDSGAIVVVEWSENIEGLLPGGAVTVTFERTGEESRRITIDGGEEI